jgi:hypothetical protein
MDFIVERFDEDQNWKFIEFDEFEYQKEGGLSDRNFSYVVQQIFETDWVIVELLLVSKIMIFNDVFYLFLGIVGHRATLYQSINYILYQNFFFFIC